MTPELTTSDLGRANGSPVSPGMMDGFDAPKETPGFSGAYDAWNAQAQALFGMTMRSPLPAAIVCGAQRLVFCNEAATRLFGWSGAPTPRLPDMFAGVWPAGLQATEQAFAGRSALLRNQLVFGSAGSNGVDAQFVPALYDADAVTCVHIAMSDPARTPPVAPPWDGPGDLLTGGDSAAEFAWRSQSEGRWTWASPQWRTYTGRTVSSSLDLGWLEVLHPDDRAPTMGCWRDAESAGSFLCDHRIYSHREQRYRWFRSRASRVRDPSSGANEWLGASVEVDDLSLDRQPPAAALAESRHSMRNTLGLVRSLARRTAETSATVEDYAMHLEGRLDALARVQAIIARAAALGAELQTLVAEELLTFGGREGARVSISGPVVRLRSDAAETLGLAIHELATNAMKFGALSPAGGTVNVSWNTAPGGELLLIWKETAGSVVRPQSGRVGFGRDLLERGLAYSLKAQTRVTFEADGLRCDIAIPLERVAQGV